MKISWITISHKKSVEDTISSFQQSRRTAAKKESMIFINTEKDLNVYHEARGGAACCTVEAEVTSCCGKTAKESVGRGKKYELQSDPSIPPNSGDKVDFNEWVASYQIYAVK